MLTLFISFFLIGLFGFGGGLSIIPLFLSTVTKYNWITENDFWFIVGTSQSLPGIVSVNLSAMLGFKINGLLGSVVATFGFVLPSIIVITIVSMILSKHKDSKWLKTIMNYTRVIPICLLSATLVDLVFRVYSDDLTMNLASLLLFINYVFIITKTKLNVIYISLAFGLVLMVI